MKKLELEKACIQNPKWENMIQREEELYKRGNDLRTEFERDYTRIIYSNAYKRLKHKTQVFFSPTNDHICTRIEHVNHVESISYTIAKELGLNTELTKAIACAHDIGHSPFGHQGEKILNTIAKEELGISFWHERNGLNFADQVELLEDDNGYKRNLNLTYAVRDGIISHCGEIDENSIKPREGAIDLTRYRKPNQYQPYTWEACVVKIADKISYIGRDIEDAIRLRILDKNNIRELQEILKIRQTDNPLNNTNIINDLICDLCQNSSKEKGLCFSKPKLNLMNQVKKFNYEKIYLSERMIPSTQYFETVIHQIFHTLKSLYNEKEKKLCVGEKIKYYPRLVTEWIEWLKKYCMQGNLGELETREQRRLLNKVIYDIRDKESYIRAILDYLAGMTDNYAIEVYNEIIRF